VCNEIFLDDDYFFQFFTVVYLLPMIGVIFISIPLATTILFRLLVPLFIVDMPRRHGNAPRTAREAFLKPTARGDDPG
jgi:hypothetical protein